MTLHLRPHTDASPEHPTDANGQTYTTVSPDLAQQYIDQARRDGQDIDISFSTGVSSNTKIDILVTDTDSIGLETPTRRHAPGY